jgi:hypothetical protein
MKPLRFVITIVLMLSVAALPASAQPDANESAWRALAERLEGGVPIDVRLRDGRHFKATLIEARHEALVVQRKTRVPVGVEQINYESIVSLSRVQPSNLSAGKIAGIALGSAGAAIGMLWLIALATLE